MKIMAQFWKLANIAKMSTSASQSRFPIEITGKIWQLTNIAKIGPCADQKSKKSKNYKTDVETRKYRQNGPKSGSTAISH